MTQRRCAFDDRLATIWDERYCTAAAPTNSTTKQAEVVRAAMEEGLLRLQPWPWNERRAWESIGRVHDARYVAAVRTGEPRLLAGSQGFRWSAAFAEAVARIWAGHAFACRLALREGLVFHPVSGAHHANAARGGGFCTFNFLVGAGRQLLETGAVGRVAIFDLDAHQGDGTWRLVQDDDRFGVFDVAGSDWLGERDGGTRSAPASASLTTPMLTARRSRSFRRSSTRSLPTWCSTRRARTAMRTIRSGASGAWTPPSSRGATAS